MPAYDQYIDNSYFIATAATFSSYKDLIVKVRGLLSGWDSYGYFVCHVESAGSTTNFILQGSTYDSQTTMTGSYYEAKGYGLNEEIDYYASIYFYPYDGGSSSRVRIPANSASSGTYVITISSGGGGGGVDPYFTASGSNTNSSITVSIGDLQDTDYDSLYYTISSGSYQDSYQGSSSSHTFSSLADGTYTVRAYYIYNNIDYPIYTSVGGSYIDITIDSGGGGGGDWSYDDSISPIAISTSTTPYTSNSFSFNAQDGYLFTFYLDQNGTVEIYSSNTFGGPLISYIGPVNNDYDTNTGIPYSYTNSDTGSFDYAFTATTGGIYYLWVTSENNSIFRFNINFTSSSVPTYAASVVNVNQIYFSVSNRGNYYLRYFVRLTSDPSNTTYDTWDTYGYLVTNTTLTVSNLQYNTSYTINVGYSSSSNSAAVTWIGSQTLQTGSATNFTYTQVSGLTVSSSQVSKYISFNANQGWIVPITITQNGILRIYTATTQSSSQDDYGYLTDALNVNYDSDGVLSSYLTYDDDSHGNREFQINYPSSGFLTAGTYYIWIKGYGKRAITTYLYVSLTPVTSSDGCVYIYTGSGGWKKAKPYIYDGGQWKPASAYVYNGSTWKITKE